MDDDERTRKLMRFLLEQEGHALHEAASAADAERHARESHFDLVTLDVMMPGLDGFELCKRVRSTSNVPILFISARGDVPSRVRGLQLGADDYLCKPFDPSELCARVSALLRRPARAPRVASDGKMRVGSITLDLAEHRVEVHRTRGGVHTAQLTQTEFRLLLVLARSAGKAFTREELQAALWGATTDPVAGYNTVNAYISELRTKIEMDPHQPRHVLTVRGVGYKLEP